MCRIEGFSFSVRWSKNTELVLGTYASVLVEVSTAKDCVLQRRIYTGFPLLVRARTDKREGHGALHLID
jgi:hypothetical protein